MKKLVLLLLSLFTATPLLNALEVTFIIRSPAGQEIKRFDYATNAEALNKMRTFWHAITDQFEINNTSIIAKAGKPGAVIRTFLGTNEKLLEETFRVDAIAKNDDKIVIIAMVYKFDTATAREMLDNINNRPVLFEPMDID